MDIREWLAENAKTRRNKYALLLGLVVFPCVLLIGLYQLYRNIDNLETTLHHNAVALTKKEAQVVNVHHAQTAFFLQMQAWRNVMLYGRDAQGMQTNLGGFLHQEAEVRKQLDTLYAGARTAHAEDKAAGLKAVLDSHQLLGKRYRDALDIYMSAKGKSAKSRIDHIVNGADRSFSERLAQTSEEIEQEYNGLAARVVATQSADIEDVQGRVELNLIAITVLILLEALLVLRIVNKSTRALNKLARESEKTVLQLAYTDPLTALPNRRLFQDRLEQAIMLPNFKNQYRALMFLDMDNFKILNDTRGHGMGDLLLKEVAKRIKGSVRESDTVARMGGDEFVVLMSELGENEQSAFERSSMIAEKVSKVLSQPYQLDQLVYNCSASIGVTLFRGDDISIEDVHKRADAAMYQAKNSGRNTVRFYDSKIQATLEARSELESQLRVAIEQKQLHLFYQIQVDQDSKPIGAEALIRWIHPKLGIVFPADFIPMAEESGLILPIGQWVLESVCRQIKLWESDPLTSELIISANVSARQFRQSSFISMVVGLIKQTGINPTRLKIELTESVVLDDVDDAVFKMHALKDVGVQFSMDDFGTGYSSLFYLTQLPLDQLKVDQSFVRNIGMKSTDSVIVQTIIDMAANLNMESIAEGVETQAQRDFLEQAGCKLYQGYLYGKPVPLKKFTDSLMELKTYNIVPLRSILAGRGV
jgi:diguanylate cyclase (GGDEF)-like protein